VINNAEEGEARSSLLQEFLSSIFERVFGQNQEENTMGSRNLVVSYQQQPRGKKKIRFLGFGFLIIFSGFCFFLRFCFIFVVRTVICGFYE